MSKIKLVTVAIVVVLFFSGCKKTENLIIGTWKITVVKINGISHVPDYSYITFEKNNMYSFFLSYSGEIVWEDGYYSIRESLLYLDEEIWIIDEIYKDFMVLKSSNNSNFLTLYCYK